MMKLQEVAQLVQGTLIGPGEREITGINTLEDAGADSIAFLSDVQYESALKQTRAEAALIPQNYQPARGDLAYIVVSDVPGAVECLLEHFMPASAKPVGVHPRALIAPSAQLADGVAVGAYAVIGEHVVIGSHTAIGEGCVIRDHVRIGSDTVLHPNVVIEERCEIGSRVILYANVTIGTDGFGYRLVNGRHKKIPHIGIAVIEDDVEIGANSCVDRAKFGQTVVGRGTKVDNLTQIAHNVVIGENCILVSQVGISGSCRLGNYVVLGGQAGVSDHVRLGDGAMVAGKSAVKDDIPPGEKVMGIPAVSAREWIRDRMTLKKLSDLGKHYKKIMHLLSQV